jgi:peptidylprolyl isomerase
MNMPEVKLGDTVKVDYVGRFKNGEIFDGTRDKVPLVFTVGGSRVIKGFEEAVLGMKPGETKIVTVPPEEAYGRRSNDRLIRIKRERLPDDAQLEIGEYFDMRQPDGRKVPVRVVEISESGVTVDANGPLAGKELVFEIELLEIL